MASQDAAVSSDERGVLVSDVNAALIVEARNALPAWLRLAEAAKALRDANQALKDFAKTLGHRPPEEIPERAWNEHARLSNVHYHASEAVIVALAALTEKEGNDG